jgi:hypothetical protein
MMVANVAASQNSIHGKFNNTMTKSSLSSSVVINKLDELE